MDKKEELHQIFNRHSRNKNDKKYQTDTNIDGFNQQNIDLSKWIISKEDLSDDDVRKICELYAFDYLCLFPFDLPPQCDKQKLMDIHNGTNIIISN